MSRKLSNDYLESKHKIFFEVFFECFYLTISYKEILVDVEIIPGKFDGNMIQKDNLLTKIMHKNIR